MLDWLLQGLFFIVVIVVSAVVFALIYIRLMQGAFSGKGAWTGSSQAVVPDVAFDDIGPPVALARPGIKPQDARQTKVVAGERLEIVTQAGGRCSCGPRPG